MDVGWLLQQTVAPEKTGWGDGASSAAMNTATIRPSSFERPRRDMAEFTGLATFPADFCRFEAWRGDLAAVHP